LKLVLLLKTLLDLITAIGMHHNKPMALMFAGFALADIGAMWMA
jgi:hypothetical protein